MPHVHIIRSRFRVWGFESFYQTATVVLLGLAKTGTACVSCLPECWEIFVLNLHVLLFSVDDVVDSISSPIAVDIHFECLRAVFRDSEGYVYNHLLLHWLFLFQLLNHQLFWRASSWMEEKLTPNLDVFWPFAPGQKQVQIAIILQFERLWRRHTVILQPSEFRPSESLQLERQWQSSKKFETTMHSKTPENFFQKIKLTTS